MLDKNNQSIRLNLILGPLIFIGGLICLGIYGLLDPVTILLSFVGTCLLVYGLQFVIKNPNPVTGAKISVVSSLVGAVIFAILIVIISFIALFFGWVSFTMPLP